MFVQFRLVYLIFPFQLVLYGPVKNVPRNGSSKFLSYTSFWLSTSHWSLYGRSGYLARNEAKSVTIHILVYGNKYSLEQKSIDRYPLETKNYRSFCENTAIELSIGCRPVSGALKSHSGKTISVDLAFKTFLLISDIEHLLSFSMCLFFHVVYSFTLSSLWLPNALLGPLSPFVSYINKSGFLWSVAIHLFAVGTC